MKKVIIYKGAKTPTQSGAAKTKFWYLKFDESNFYEEDLMTGWKGSLHSSKKTKIKFTNLDNAVEYAKKMNFEFHILNEDNNELKIKSYADNFKFNRNKSDIE